MNNWENITGIELELLKTNRKILHQAIQIVGAFPRNLLPYDPTDASASLEWNSEKMALESLHITNADRSIKVGLSFISFDLYIDTDGSLVASKCLNELSVNDGIHWLKGELSKLNINADQLNLNLPYEIENYDYSKALQVDPNAISEYKKLYQNTQQILEPIFKKWKDAYDIRCWPHHFDLATLIPIETNAEGEIMKSIGVGLSPGDEGVEEPYVYVNVWPNVNLDILEKQTLLIGHWNKEGWSGAVMTYTQLLKMDNQEEGFESFINTVIGILNK